MNTRFLSLLAALAVALLLTFTSMTITTSRAQMDPLTQPLDQLNGDDFDKAFLSQMSMHHAMAVVMARPAVAQAAHQETKDLAQGIIDEQTKEIAQMRSWAKDWYGMDIADPVAMMDSMQQGGSSGMQGMPGMSMSNGHGMPGMPGMSMSNGHEMPGMPMGQMSDMPMMASLWKLPPQRLEVVFLSQMIPHHQSAIDMANLVPDRAAHQELKDLARNIIQSQGNEIGTMNAWLSAWYNL